MDTALEQHTLVDGTILKIYQDEDCYSPREDDNLGTMICWHRRYFLGDKHKFSTPDEFREWWKTQKGIILPLYLYDHSGITMSTSPFSCPWDSGQVGWLYVTNEKIRKDFNTTRVTKKLREKVDRIVKCEVHAYDNYLRGNCYGYIHEDADGEHIDSCWGFIGDDIESCGISDYFPDELKGH